MTFLFHLWTSRSVNAKFDPNGVYTGLHTVLLTASPAQLPQLPALPCTPNGVYTGLHNKDTEGPISDKPSTFNFRRGARLIGERGCKKHSLSG